MAAVWVPACVRATGGMADQPCWCGACEPPEDPGEADRSGAFMLAVWDFDPNAHHAPDDPDSIVASVELGQVDEFKAFSEARGWRVSADRAAGDLRRFITVTAAGEVL